MSYNSRPSNGRQQSSPSTYSPPNQSINQSMNQPVNHHPHFHQSGLSKAEAESSWQMLGAAIDEIRSNNQSSLRFEELYRTAYMLVLHKYGEFLYLKIQDKLIDQLIKVRQKLEKVSMDRLLGCLIDEFDAHRLIMSLIKDIMMYLDKRFCAKQKVVPIYDLGMLLFRDQVLRYNQSNNQANNQSTNLSNNQQSLHAKVKHLLLEQVDRERNGESIDRSIMQSVLAMLVSVNVHSLEVYQLDFETDFLIHTQSFYQSISQSFFTSNACPDYLKMIEQSIRDEESRADTYLHPSTRSKLRNVAYTELIGKYAKSLVDDEKSGAVCMMKRGQVEDLHRLYVLFAMYQQHQSSNQLLSNPINQPAGGSRRSSIDQSISQSTGQSPLDMLRDCMSQQVKLQGVELLAEKDHRAEPQRFVQGCLSIIQTFNQFVEQCFCSDRAFIRSLKDSLEYFMNSDARTASYLSSYLDEFMRKESKSINQSEVDQKLNQIISLFRLLHDKDVFEECYKQSLSQRLLSSSSANYDIERSLIAKLKTECGHQYTSRLEGMFKDIELSKSLTKTYNDSTKVSGTRVDCELGVSVLTTGFWPLPAAAITHDVQFPIAAQNVIQHFSAYYSGIHSGRRLAWIPSMGTCELRAEFTSGRKELLVHTYQMIILMLFNDRESYTFDEIGTMTRIPSVDLTRHLLSLAHPSVKVLKKNPNTRAVESSHTFSLNLAYSSPYYRVKIPLLGKPVGEPDDMTDAGEKAGVPAAVVEARKNGVEAAIVRIMKARKTCDHSSVCAEVSKQLSQRFTVDATFIKKRIESLIEREYIARDSKDRRLYHYLA